MEYGRKILVFTEGTILNFSTWRGKTREEISTLVKEGHVPDDFGDSVPVGRAVDRIKAWQSNGAEIEYLTSRTEPAQIEDVRNALQRFGFPEGRLHFRREGETYGAVAERVMPDVIVEDNCESIGGEAEMTWPQIAPERRARIRSVVVKEFGGIDHLPDDLA